jgi:hypothetical protein
MKPWNKYKLDECNRLLQPLPLLPALMQDTGAVPLLQPLPLLPAQCTDTRAVPLLQPLPLLPAQCTRYRGGPAVTERGPCYLRKCRIQGRSRCYSRCRRNLR